MGILYTCTVMQNALMCNQWQLGARLKGLEDRPVSTDALMSIKS